MKHIVLAIALVLVGCRTPAERTSKSEFRTAPPVTQVHLVVRWWEVSNGVRRLPTRPVTVWWTENFALPWLPVATVWPPTNQVVGYTTNRCNFFNVEAAKP